MSTRAAKASAARAAAGRPSGTAEHERPADRRQRQQHRFGHDSQLRIHQSDDRRPEFQRPDPVKRRKQRDHDCRPHRAARQLRPGHDQQCRRIERWQSQTSGGSSGLRAAKASSAHRAAAPTTTSRIKASASAIVDRRLDFAARAAARSTRTMRVRQPADQPAVGLVRRRLLLSASVQQIAPRSSKERGAFLIRPQLREDRGLAFDPGAKLGRARIEFDDKRTVPRLVVRVDPCYSMAEVGERAGDRDVGQRQPVADQKPAVIRHDAFQIIEDRRQIVRARPCSAASRSPGAPETRCNDPVEEDLRRRTTIRIVSANSSNQMVLPRSFGFDRDQRRLGCLASR